MKRAQFLIEHRHKKAVPDGESTRRYDNTLDQILTKLEITSA